jgi:hypothetical protein
MSEKDFNASNLEKIVNDYINSSNAVAESLAKQNQAVLNVLSSLLGEENSTEILAEIKNKMGNIVTPPSVKSTASVDTARDLSENPAIAMSSLYNKLSNEVAMAAANAIYEQQQANEEYLQALTIAITKLLSANK